MTPRGLRACSLGDSAVTIAFGTERSAELLERIHAAARSLEAVRIPHVQDVVPAYLALTVFYDSLHASYAEMAARLLDACERDDFGWLMTSRLYNVHSSFQSRERA